MKPNMTLTLIIAQQTYIYVFQYAEKNMWMKILLYLWFIITGIHEPTTRLHLQNWNIIYFTYLPDQQPSYWYMLNEV